MCPIALHNGEFNQRVIKVVQWLKLPWASILEFCRGWAFRVFVAYIALIAVFAWFYYRIYLRDETSFAFNSDILNVRMESIRHRNIEAEAKLVDSRKAIAELAAALGGYGVAPTTNTVDTESYHCVYSDTSAPEPEAKSMLMRTLELRIFNRSDELVFETNLIEPVTIFHPPSKQIDLARCVADVNDEIESIRRRTANLIGKKARAWDYVDFFYFSMITQTTVGYGDILPNSTEVRIVVTAQILAGLFLLTIIINMKLPQSSGDGKKCASGVSTPAESTHCHGEKVAPSAIGIVPGGMDHFESDVYLVSEAVVVGGNTGQEPLF
jgi:hypothetical protein